MAVPEKRYQNACQLGASSSQETAGNAKECHRFVEGSIVRIFMENFL